MPDPPKEQVTRLLQRWSQGEEDAMAELMDVVYAELRDLARRYLRRERSGHTLETSALVHEAFVKLIDQNRVQWQSRAHFYAIAAQTMRRILVDHARSHTYQKRGGGARKVSLEDALQIGDVERAPDLVALDDALKRLAESDPDRARLVELRFFGGLSHPEIAEVLGVSTSTIERQWRLARAWLYKALSP